MEYYGPDQKESLHFTYANLSNVMQNSLLYSAIIIFSHGTIINGKGYFAIGDENTGLHQMPINRHNYQLVSTESMLQGSDMIASNCILYLGVCDGVGSQGFKGNENAPAIAYSGRTCMAEANAAMLFHQMLYEGCSLEEAYECLLPEPNYANTKHFKTDKVDYRKIAYDQDLQTKYLQNCEVTYKKTDSYYADTDEWEHSLGGKFSGDQEYVPMIARVLLYPILDQYWWGAGGDYGNNVSNWSIVDENYIFSSIVHIKGQHEGIYKYVVEGVVIDPMTGKFVCNEDGYWDWQRVKPNKQRFVVYSKNYKSHGENPSLPDEETAIPNVLGSDGLPMKELSITASGSQSFNIDGYSGHTLKALSFDEDVVTVSVSGTVLTINGVSEGSAYIGAYDVQNLKMAVLKITVTVGSDTHTTCPDDNHPHMIDLGLPSGTKWACCNVGANSPEEYGGYYTFDEAQEFNPPTLDQIKELLDNTTSEWTTLNGVNGRKFTGSNGGTIFLPAAGLRWDFGWDSGHDGAGSHGRYWSSTLYESSQFNACDLRFGSDYANWLGFGRGYGQSVRPVR